jgi:hypothetical protein
MKVCCSTWSLAISALLLFPALVPAQFSCTTNADGVSVTVTGYSGPGGDVTIPDTVNDLTVTAIGNNALWFNSNITGITITNNGISIGSQAFLRSYVLTNAVLGAGVTNIGAQAFAYINSLLNISVDPLNPYYSSLGGVLFDSSQTTLIQCPAGMTGSYTVPATVTCIGSHAFYYCLSITSVALPQSVTNIQDNGFNDCGMTNIVLGTNVVAIGDNAFWQSGLNNVSLPASVTNIGLTPFRYCGGLPAITVDPLNPAYSSLDGVLMDAGRTTVIECPGGKPGTFVTPATVTNIGQFAFFGCNKLTNIVISDGLISVSDYAFWGSNVRNIQLPDSVTSLGNGAFYVCSLRNITFGSGITNIGNDAFYDCFSLSRVLFTGSNAPALGADVFYSAGSNPGSNPTVYYPLGATGWGSTFGGLPAAPWDPISQCACTNVNGAVTITGYLGTNNSVTVPAAVAGLPVKAIGNNAFYGNSSLSSIILPNDILSIGSYAFYGDSSLSNIVLPSSLLSISNYAFYGCAKLRDFQLPAGLTYMGSSAFSGCSNLTQLTIPIGVTNFLTTGGFQFAQCPSLTAMYFQGNVPAFGESMFSGDTNLTLYYLPGTTGWSATDGGRPAVLWNPQVLTTDASFGVRTNRFGFTLSGSSNLVIVVAAATNLVNAVWTPIGTNKLNKFIGTNGTSYFSDPQWTSYPARFYRLRSP